MKIVVLNTRVAIMIDIAAPASFVTGFIRRNIFCRITRILLPLINELADIFLWTTAAQDH